MKKQKIIIEVEEDSRIIVLGLVSGIVLNLLFLALFRFSWYNVAAIVFATIPLLFLVKIRKK